MPQMFYGSADERFGFRMPPGFQTPQYTPTNRPPSHHPQLNQPQYAIDPQLFNPTDTNGDEEDNDNSENEDEDEDEDEAEEEPAQHDDIGQNLDESHSPETEEHAALAVLPRVFFFLVH